MPAFRVGKPSWILGQSTPQTIAAGGTIDLEWDVVEWEDPVVLVSATEVEVDRPGLYLVGAYATRAAAASASVVTVRLRRNGTSELLDTLPNAAGAITGKVIRLLKLDAGDLLTINVTFHATLSTTTAIGSTEFWGSRVGPERWTG